MNVTPAIREDVHDKIRACIERAEQQLNREFTPSYEVRFDLRGRTAGMCVCDHTGIYERFVLRFNVDLLNSDHYGEMLQQTVPHEVAHMLARMVFGRRAKGHGKPWKTMMHVLGVEALRCHNFDVEPARKVRRWEYVCGCKTWQLTTVRHNRIVKGTQRYSCPKCNTRLERAAA